MHFEPTSSKFWGDSFNPQSFIFFRFFFKKEPRPPKLL